MATWKSENSMLTQRGVEILNKIKAGIGSITVSAVMTGSGRVPESQLYTQTALSGSKKDMSIVNKYTTETGSEISVNISNDGFTESYNIHQIGVFVTHPDYEGQQLYLISQCDAEDFDTIPAFNETPVIFGYSLFLEHGNSSSINISINSQGVLLAEDFERFKGDITEGNLVSVSANKSLANSGKKLSDIDNKNLLHNWYFVNPVDQKVGYIIPANTNYYSDEALTTKVGVTYDYSKIVPVDVTYGYIILGDKVYYASMSTAVRGCWVPWNQAIDRWLCGGDGIVKLQENGLYIKGAFDQFVGTILTVGDYTCSILLTDGTVYSKSFHYNGVDASSHTVEGVALLLLDPTSGFEGRPRFSVFPIDAKLNGRNFVAIKLEKGLISTILHDVPADYAEQMAICIQYDPNGDGAYRGFTPLYTANILAKATLEE